MLTQSTKKPSNDFAAPFADMADDDLGPVDLSAKPKNRFEKRTPTDRAETLYSDPCPKCGGSGWIPSFSFREAGRCFKCDGKGVLLFKTPKAVRDASKIKAAARKEKKLADNLSSFESEHPVVAAWWTGSTFEFAISLRENVQKFGRLTDGQLKAAYKCAEKFNEAKKAKDVQRAAQTEAAAPVDITPITKSLDRAKKKGLQHPKMHLLGGDVKLVFSLAPAHGKNAGAVYVKDSSEGTYLGKVQGGRFFKSYDCDESQAKAVEVACVDPENAAIAYGKKFGICACCNRDLSDPDSVARGIGPICADKFFG